MSDISSATKARQFADLAYNTKREEISRSYREKLREKRNALVGLGEVRSGATVVETARLHGGSISDLLVARLDSLLEGYDLHNVDLDEQISASIIEDIAKTRGVLVRNAVQYLENDPICKGIVNNSQFEGLVNQHVGTSPASIKVVIERKRFMKKPDAPPSTSYHIQGDNSRVNINSTDQSVNVATKLSEAPEDAERRTHKVLLYVLGAASAGGFATARVIASIYPNSAWWLNCGSVAVVLVTICIALISRWKRLRVLIIAGTSIMALVVIGLFWRYRTLPPGTVLPTAPQSTQVESHGDQSPNVVNNQGRVEIQNSSGETDKKDKPKTKGGK